MSEPRPALTTSASPRRVVLASGNPGKQRELESLLGPHGIELILQAALGIPAAEEWGTSFQANALLKAEHAARLSGLPALADDSGLEVDALDGRPGVHSARYAGDAASDADNNARLLQELRGVPAAARAARYRCVLALVRGAHDPLPVLASASWQGCIATAAAGRGGFGYDPLFVPEGSSRSAAEMPAELKNRVSHRARALAQLLARLAEVRW